MTCGLWKRDEKGVQKVAHVSRGALPAGHFGFSIFARVMEFRDISITSRSRDLEIRESRDLKGQKTPQRIRAEVRRDSARGRV